MNFTVRPAPGSSDFVRRCSFCGGSREDGYEFMYGHGVSICRKCAVMAAGLLSEGDNSGDTESRVKRLEVEK